MLQHNFYDTFPTEVSSLRKRSNFVVQVRFYVLIVPIKISDTLIHCPHSLWQPNFSFDLLRKIEFILVCHITPDVSFLRYLQQTLQRFYIININQLQNGSLDLSVLVCGQNHIRVSFLLLLEASLRFLTAYYRHS